MIDYFKELENKEAVQLSKQITDVPFDIIAQIADKTFGAHLSEVKAMTPEESAEWHRKHSYRDEEGNLVISSDIINE